MTTVKFLQPCTVKDLHGETFAAGQVVSMSDASARHWIRRGKAVECEPPPAPPAAPKAPPPPTAAEEEVEETRAEMEKAPTWQRPPDRRNRR